MVFESIRRFVGMRFLAWGELDLYHLGGDPWVLSRFFRLHTGDKK